MSSGAPEWWVSGRSGTLSPWSQALVWGLYKASEIKNISLTNAEIASQVYKVGTPKAHPSAEAVGQLCAKIDADVDWYPGKTLETGCKPGKKKVITVQQENALAKSMMARKEKGLEVSVSAAIAACPKATLNPETGEPFSAKVLLDVFRTKCYDKDPEHPWAFRTPVNKTALSDEAKKARWDWAKTMLAKKHHAAWYFRHIIWFDPCHCIVPATPKTIFDSQMANYGKGKRWISDDATGESKNSRASPYAGKQERWGDRKLWWYVVLARGKVHVEVMPDSWQQNGAGQAVLVGRLPYILDKMLGKRADKPHIAFTDRGPGFYHSSTGSIDPDYRAALDANSLEAWAGDFAKWQPADLPDFLLHETVVAWIRAYLRHHPVKWGTDLQRNVRNTVALLEEAAEYINAWYDVEGLCHDVPKRLKELDASEGERLKH